MTWFTVEVTLTPVTVDEDWDRLRRVLDIVPGTILLEDADQPVLVFAVEAAEPLRALMFVDGLSKLVPFKVVSGTAYQTPEIDFMVSESDSDAQETTTPVVQRMHDWVDSLPAAPSERELLSA